MIMLIVQAVNSTKGITNRILVAIINQLIHSIALVSLLILVMMTFHSKKGAQLMRVSEKYDEEKLDGELDTRDVHANAADSYAEDSQFLRHLRKRWTRDA